MSPIGYYLAGLVVIVALCTLSGIYGYHYGCRGVTTTSSTSKSTTTEHIVITKPDQTVVTIDREIAATVSEKVVDKASEKVYNTYSIGVVYPVKFEQPAWNKPRIDVGYRVLGPVWGTVEWDMQHSEGALGVRIEF